MGPELVGLKANEWTYKRGIYALFFFRKQILGRLLAGGAECGASVCGSKI